MKPVETAVQADKSVSALTIQTISNGQKQAMVTVTGGQGQSGRHRCENRWPLTLLPRARQPSWSSLSTQPSPLADGSPGHAGRGKRPQWRGGVRNDLLRGFGSATVADRCIYDGVLFVPVTS